MSHNIVANIHSGADTNNHFHAYASVIRWVHPLGIEPKILRAWGHGCQLPGCLAFCHYTISEWSYV